MAAGLVFKQVLTSFQCCCTPWLNFRGFTDHLHASDRTHEQLIAGQGTCMRPSGNVLSHLTTLAQFLFNELHQVTPG